MYTAPKRRAGVGASFRVHKLCPRSRTSQQLFFALFTWETNTQAQLRDSYRLHEVL